MCVPAGLDDALGRIYLYGARDLKKKHRRSYACHAKIVDIYIFIALHYQNLCTLGTVASLLSLIAHPRFMGCFQEWFRPGIVLRL